MGQREGSTATRAAARGGRVLRSWVHIIGSILANYDINDKGDVCFICVAAASSYNEFLHIYGKGEEEH